MKKNDELFEKFKLKKCLNSTIDVLISQELTSNDLSNEVKKVTKSILPNSNMYLMSVICNYAKAKQSLYCYEKILNNAIDEYKFEVSDDDVG